MSSPDGAQGSVPPSVGGFVLESDSAGKHDIQEQEVGDTFPGELCTPSPEHILRL